MKSILVFGASSAIAQACTRLWAQEPARFLLIARNENRLIQVSDDLRARGSLVEHVVSDLGRTELHAQLIDDLFSRMPVPDVILIAHGVLPDQSLSERDTDNALNSFVVNGLGVLSLLDRCAVRLQANREGCLAIISSVAGDRGRQSNYWYGAAKGAVSIFCEGLRGRLLASNVKVLLIKPGFVDTPMIKGLNLSGPLLARPERVAKDIVNAITRGRTVLYTPWFWRYIMLVIKHIPTFIFKRLKI